MEHITLPEGFTAWGGNEPCPFENGTKLSVIDADGTIWEDTFVGDHPADPIFWDGCKNINVSERDLIIGYKLS